VNINILQKAAIFLFLVSVIGEKLTAQNGLAITNSSSFKGAESTGSGINLFEFQTYVSENDIASISEDALQDHVFGQLIARKVFLLESKYTSQVPVIPGNPQTKTIIRKAVIYDAVHKMEHYLKKSVRKGNMSSEIATGLFDKVLDVALNVYAADSNNFEKTISKIDDPADLIVLFTKRVNLVQ
jgi:hypothetical protein